MTKTSAVKKASVSASKEGSGKASSSGKVSSDSKPSVKESTKESVKSVKSKSAKSVRLPAFTIRQLLEAGVHFGHKTMRWNPKMSQYIFGSRNKLHIIDLQKTAPLLHNAMAVARDVAKKNGRILFVATKKQATEAVAEAANRCGQYYTNQRWLGGMLTNWKTVSRSIKTLQKIEEKLGDEESGLNKKERLVLDRKREKLEAVLGGIRTMGGYPNLIIVIDIRKEALAVKEAKLLGIPVMAVVDTNCNPDPIDFPIPGNDDSIKAIKLYCKLLSDAILDGIKENMQEAGVDVDVAKRPAKSAKSTKPAADSKIAKGKDEADQKGKNEAEEGGAKKAASVKKSSTAAKESSAKAGDDKDKSKADKASKVAEKSKADKVKASDTKAKSKAKAESAKEKSGTAKGKAEKVEKVKKADDKKPAAKKASAKPTAKAAKKEDK